MHNKFAYLFFMKRGKMYKEKIYKQEIYKQEIYKQRKKTKEKSHPCPVCVLEELSVVLSVLCSRPAAGCSSHQQRVAFLHCLLDMLIWNQAAK